VELLVEGELAGQKTASSVAKVNSRLSGSNLPASLTVREQGWRAAYVPHALDDAAHRFAGLLFSFLVGKANSTSMSE